MVSQQNILVGDTYMKKLCALEAPVLLVVPGFIYWRISPGQASGRLSKNFNGFRNNVAIEKDILSQLKKKAFDIPFDMIQENIYIRDIKLLFKNTFLKGKIKAGIKLFFELNFKFKDLKYLFKKGDYSYYQALKNSSVHPSLII